MNNFISKKYATRLRIQQERDTESPDYSSERDFLNTEIDNSFSIEDLDMSIYNEKKEYNQFNMKIEPPKKTESAQNLHLFFSKNKSTLNSEGINHLYSSNLNLHDKSDIYKTLKKCKGDEILIKTDINKNTENPKLKLPATNFKIDYNKAPLHKNLRNSHKETTNSPFQNNYTTTKSINSSKIQKFDEKFHGKMMQLNLNTVKNKEDSSNCMTDDCKQPSHLEILNQPARKQFKSIRPVTNCKDYFTKKTGFENKTYEKSYAEDYQASSKINDSLKCADYKPKIELMNLIDEITKETNTGNILNIKPFHEIMINKLGCSKNAWNSLLKLFNEEKNKLSQILLKVELFGVEILNVIKRLETPKSLLDSQKAMPIFSTKFFGNLDINNLLLKKSDDKKIVVNSSDIILPSKVQFNNSIIKDELLQERKSKCSINKSVKSLTPIINHKAINKIRQSETPNKYIKSTESHHIMKVSNKTQDFSEN